MVHTDSSFDTDTVLSEEGVVFHQWDSQSDIKSLLKEPMLGRNRENSAGSSSTEDASQSAVAYNSP